MLRVGSEARSLPNDHSKIELAQNNSKCLFLHFADDLNDNNSDDVNNEIDVLTPLASSTLYLSLYLSQARHHYQA